MRTFHKQERLGVRPKVEEWDARLVACLVEVKAGAPLELREQVGRVRGCWRSMVLSQAGVSESDRGSVVCSVRKGLLLCVPGPSARRLCGSAPGARDTPRLR